MTLDWLETSHGGGRDRLLIRGGRRLNGRIRIGGSKNAVLPILAATLLTGETVTLHNVPRLSDVDSMLTLLAHLGSHLTPGRLAGIPDIDGLCCAMPELVEHQAPYDLVRKMRSSVLVLGPLLGRFGKGSVSLPGGCAIGVRPVDLHLKGLEALGAEISLSQGYIEAHVPRGRLKGTEIDLEFASVGATQNIMMAATLAEGETIIHGAAREPEIGHLADCLNRMGGCVNNAGSSDIRIIGQTSLGGADYSVRTDRIQAGSYILAVAATGGQAVLEGIDFDDLQRDFGQAMEVLSGAGVVLTPNADGVGVVGHAPRPLSVATAPFPGFPTDLQAQLMALLTRAPGQSVITARIFENRFMHVPEMQRMGADIVLQGAVAMINGSSLNRVPPLSGAEVMATDIRASFGLIILALLAEGETSLQRLYHLDRGYERLTESLIALGADVERVGQ